MFTVRRFLATVLLLSLFCLPGYSQDQKKKPQNSDVDAIGTRDINKGSINFISLEREIAIGRELAQEVEQQSKMFTDPVVTEYVNRIGQNLVRNSDAKVPFTIKVIDSDEINAFALPGGFFYVNTALILAADDEAELAGVMAHEIAHVAARHGTKQQSKAELLNVASIPLIFLGGPIGYGIRQASGLLVPISFLKFSRNAEAEADYLGVQYMYKTGYDPSAMVRFFEKLQAQEKAKPGSVSKLFSDHPPTGDRIQKVSQAIESVLPAKEQYVETTSEFARVKARLAQLEKDTPKVDDNRPSLRRRTRPSTSTDGDDQDRPTLKRNPTDTTNTPTTTTPPDSSGDDQPPVLKRKPL